jgi:hypothetical protein
MESRLTTVRLMRSRLTTEGEIDEKQADDGG